MKRTLLAAAILGLLLPFAQVSKGVDVSVDFFYNNMSGGSWIEVGDYGYCWQPDVVVSNSNWRPYSDGYWAYTDLGWTWVSYEDFGWATYHYGRWTRLSDYGWVWVPGRDEDLEWGPAWVSWRTSDTYVGWAPLPPTGIHIYEGRPITGQVDIEFDIGPSYYNFCDVRFIGEPVLRERIVDVNQNVMFVNQTVNVTNITYKNKVVYNYGPDIDVINKHAARPIQRLKLERQENVDASVAIKSGAVTKVQGDRLVVAAPMHIKKSEKGFTPPIVKTKVEKAKIDKGWSGVGDEKAQTEFRQKIKSQDLHKIPTGAAAGAAGQAGAVASPAAGANAAAGANLTGAASPGASPFERGKNKDKHPGERANVTGAQPGGSPVDEASPTGAGADLERGKAKGRRGEMPMTGGSPAGAAAASESSFPGSPKIKDKGKHGEMPTRSPGGLATDVGAAGETASPLEREKKKTKYPDMGAPQSTGQTGAQPAEVSGDQGQGKHQGRRLEQGQPPVSSPGADVQGSGVGKHKGPEMQPTNVQPTNVQPQGGAAAGGGEQRQGKGEGKKLKGEASPVPSP